MTREQAIKYFKRHLDLYCVDGISREAEEMAIQALSQEPTDTWSIKEVADTFKKHGLIREQQPCDDAVSRDAVKELIKSGVSTDTYDDVEQVCKWIDALPPVSTTKSIVNHGTMNITL